MKPLPTFPTQRSSPPPISHGTVINDRYEIRQSLGKGGMGEVFLAYDLATQQPVALKIVRDDSPDIVLLDVMMPGMDGFEVCRRMKQDPASSHIPVVMVTALSDVADRVRGLEAGADDFLTKPINDVALLARVKSLVRLKMMLDELRLREDTSEQLGAIDDPAGTDGV